MTDYAEYQFIVARIIEVPHEKSRHKIRAQPLPGQWADPALRLECPLNIRNAQNVGQLYKFRAKYKKTLNALQLYSPYWWQPEKISLEEAETFIAARSWTVDPHNQVSK